MSNHYIRGLLTEIITPFNEDGSIDYEMMRDLIQFQLDNGVTNFFVNGLGAECHELTLDEKIALLKVVREKCTNGEKIMACAFESSLEWNKQLIDAYKETEMCDCYCITAPPFFKHTPEAMYDWSAQLIDYCDKPCYIYNCVQMGTLFDPEVLEKLWKNHPNFKGYKDASVNILHLEQVMLRIDKDHFDFLGGCDGLDGIMMLMGAVGCVSFMAVPFPAEMKAIVDYGLAGDYEKCMEAQYKVLKIRNALKMAPFNAAYMYAQKFTGGPIVKHSRMPKHQDFVSEEAIFVIEKTIQEIGY